MAQSLTLHRPVLAIGLRLGAICMFTVMAALIKATSDHVPPGQAVFVRSLFAIPVIFAWLAYRHELAGGVRVDNLRGHILRGVIGTSAMGLSFAGLGLLPLPDVTAIGYAAPIFTVVLAAIFLGEHIRLFRISAVAIGLLGVMVMIWPRLSTAADWQEGAALGAIMILAATLARACVQIQVRQLVKTDSTAAIVFWFSITATVLSLATLPFGWVVPPLDIVLVLICGGLIGGAAQILVTSSLRYGPASMLAPCDYVSMLFAIVIGFVWFGEWPTPIMLIGAVLVIVGNMLVIWREHQPSLECGRARSPMDAKN